MARLMLSDELWFKLKESMLQHRYNKPNLRTMIERMVIPYVCWLSLARPTNRFWMLESNYQQFNRGSSKNQLMQIFNGASPGYRGSAAAARRRWGPSVNTPNDRMGYIDYL